MNAATQSTSLGSQLLFLQGLSYGFTPQCNTTYNLAGNSQTYWQSPNYPYKYPPGFTCLYTFVAPLDYEIVADCVYVIDKAESTCSTEYFFMSLDGDSSLSSASGFCGSGSVTRTSLFRRLIIGYASGSTSYNVGGAFNCRLTTQEQPCDCGWSQMSKIVAGVETDKLEFPSMVGLYHWPSQTVFCGGSIINHRTIVTATHCTRRYPYSSQVLILAGYHNLSSIAGDQYGAIYRVSGYIEHPSYDDSTDLNDIALIITATNIEWSRGVGPICLPMNMSQTFEYEKVDLVGWGTTSFAGPKSSTLQKAIVNVLENSACKNVYPYLESSQLCTFDNINHADSCQFDSGGPVVKKAAKRQFLVGVISYGQACGINPSVNTRITSFFNWIKYYAAGRICYMSYDA